MGWGQVNRLNHNKVPSPLKEHASSNQDMHTLGECESYGIEHATITRMLGGRFLEAEVCKRVTCKLIYKYYAGILLLRDRKSVV